MTGPGVPCPRGYGPNGRRIGVLGGSFNPAHAGHRHLTGIALRRLGLDEVWWLVSPGNPLKPARDMAPLARRLAGARRVAGDRRVRVLDLESRLGTRYTADTLPALRRRYPACRFVWLMGADNLWQIPAWDRWPVIFNTMPVAIVARGVDGGRSLAGGAAQRFRRRRLPERQAGLLADAEPPAWVFLHSRRHPASATALRRPS